MNILAVPFSNSLRLSRLAATSTTKPIKKYESGNLLIYSIERKNYNILENDNKQDVGP